MTCRADDSAVIAPLQPRGHTRTHLAAMLAFVAGRERFLGENASLGFHAVSAPVFSIDLNADYDRFLAVRGIDRKFIRRAAATPANDMWYPTNDELKAAGMITAVR